MTDIRPADATALRDAAGSLRITIGQRVWREDSVHEIRALEQRLDALAETLERITPEMAVRIGRLVASAARTRELLGNPWEPGSARARAYDATLGAEVRGLSDAAAILAALAGPPPPGVASGGL